jgi:hypothetical protein
MIKIKKEFFKEESTKPFLMRIVNKFLKQGLIDESDLVPIFTENFEKNLTTYSLNLAKKIFSSSKKDFKSLSNLIKDKRKVLEEKIQLIWGEPLTLLDIFLLQIAEIIDVFNQDHQQTAKEQKDHKFLALIRINYRACRAGYEILALLEKGFTDGATARWRTLHEFEVISSFIQKNNDSVAEKYLQHEIIESYKDIKIYQNSVKEGAEKPFTDEQINEVEKRYEELINKYGKDYKEDYGWAANIINGNQRPDFTHLEEFVNLAHARPHVKRANHSVHSTAKGTLFTLGVPDARTMLLSGPSIIGLAKPGYDTAISLMRTCMALLLLKPKRQNLVVIQTMQEFVNEIGQTFAKADRT